MICAPQLAKGLSNPDLYQTLLPLNRAPRLWSYHTTCGTVQPRPEQRAYIEHTSPRNQQSNKRVDAQSLEITSSFRKQHSFLKRHQLSPLSHPTAPTCVHEVARFTPFFYSSFQHPALYEHVVNVCCGTIRAAG